MNDDGELPRPNWLVVPALPPIHVKYSVPAYGATNTPPVGGGGELVPGDRRSAASLRCITHVFGPVGWIIFPPMPRLLFHICERYDGGLVGPSRECPVISTVPRRMNPKRHRLSSYNRSDGYFVCWAGLWN